MRIICKIFGHNWDGCKCTICGKVRDEGHNWNTIQSNIESSCFQKCKCCGELKTSNHQMSIIADRCYQKCAICGFKSNPVHTWNGCICSICGEQRDEKHQWIRTGCKERCIKCGKTREDDSFHSWVRDKCLEKCVVCGKQKESHDYLLIRTETEYGSGKCAYIQYSDDYICNFCKTPNACLKYPQTNKELYKCSRCGKEKWQVYNP